ncbi:contractile injection system protein, VgrG/Pvc8 family [Acidovorax sp. Leaf160]|uniref:contractile injection system protein, VgrG/Pvc8 family n=1 Tax=Acidovorax sp. Leaf160 TaxID=1736280 RepID=UPI0006F3F751|nr:contractile injection system protein, VgrG/Pvc8 family [Acidovorax sp. Leaf160]KQR50140.1 late control protein [Acidovorax sp. Leaf160]
MAPNSTDTPHRQVQYALVVNGRDITATVRPLLMRLRLRESRGEEADQLDITLDDALGNLALPPVGATVAVQLGYRHTGMIDKGTYTVDEIEHTGAPDVVQLRCRSAELRATLRQRATQSWHGATLGQIVRDIAAKNKLQPKVDDALASIAVQHIDQTNESDVHFLTRLGRQHDAVATVKKGRLVFLPIGSTTNAAGQQMEAILLTREAGDQHRYHSAARDSYSGVRAYWYDNKAADRKEAIAGDEANLKTLPHSYASKSSALRAARAEQGRIARGAATLEIALAIGQPALMVQTPVNVRGWKPEIDGTGWLCKTVEHSLENNGLTTRLELELQQRETKAREPEAAESSPEAEEDVTTN